MVDAEDNNEEEDGTHMGSTHICVMFISLSSSMLQNISSNCGLCSDLEEDLTFLKGLELVRSNFSGYK